MDVRIAPHVYTIVTIRESIVPVVVVTVKVVTILHIRVCGIACGSVGSTVEDSAAAEDGLLSA